MPELPEVETVARTLAPLVEGQTLLRLRVLDARLGPLPLKRVRARRVGRVFRLGKQVLFELDPSSAGGPPHWLGVHLRMTGRLLWRAADDKGSVDLPQLRALFELERGTVLFQDTRRFGTIAFYEKLAAAKPEGIDPTSRAFTVDSLEAALRRGSDEQEIKPWLLRQDRLVGVGNIYASEILWHAGVAPARRLKTLKKPEIAAIWKAVGDVLAAAIEACGTTFSDFQNARGSIGSYQAYLRVYGREGEPCPSCQEPVQRRVQAQRSTYFCRRCQR